MGKTYKCETCQDIGVVEETCVICNGSGEGMYDGSRCPTCRGKGTCYIQCPDCDIIRED